MTFRRFAEKHSELSVIYWTHLIGAQAVSKALDGIPDETFTVDALGVPTKQNQYGFTAKETKDGTEIYLERSRLHLLAICCANLESYLKDVTFFYIAAKGYKEGPGKLSPIGSALGSPILEKSSLPGPLDYAQYLFGVNFGHRLDLLKLAYKYRSALVHNGGIVTPRTLNELQLPPSRLHSRLGYTWLQLKAALEAAYEIAELTDLERFK